MNDIPLMSLAVLLLLMACRAEPLEVCTWQPEPLFSTATYPIGFAANPSLLRQDEQYWELANVQFNSLTPENHFKPLYLQPAPGEFDWVTADQLILYGEQQNKRVHGHTLIWHNQSPGWMQTYSGSREQWDSLMKVHIQTVVGHFKGKVSGWDVVNEAIDDQAEIRKTFWYEQLGKDYLAKAFQYAHEADPEAKLFYNDYNLSTDSRKREAAKIWLDSLRAEGIPIHGIGLQMHIGIKDDQGEIQAAMEAFANDRYLIHLSEIDISVNRAERNLPEPTNRQLTQQAEMMRFVKQAYDRLPAELQYGLTFWGVGDGDSWIPGWFGREDYPLLFDQEYLPKPMYCAMWD